jgi:CBS-domain-containing membrane protein
MYVPLFAGCAFAGGILSALLGWMGSDPPEPFVLRKFMASIIKAFLAAIGSAALSTLLPPVGAAALWGFCFAAVLAGAGFESGIKRIVDSATTKLPPVTGTTTSLPGGTVGVPYGT